MTQALVKGFDRYRYRGTPGDEVIFTTKTDYRDEGAANTVVDAELAEATDDAASVGIAMTVVPRNGDDAMFEDIDIGDAVSAPDIDAVRSSHRVVAIPVTESSLGVVKFGLELNSRIDNEQAAHQQWLERITPGALSGRSEQVSSTDMGVGIPFGELRSSSFTYQQSGALVAELDYEDPEDDGHSDDWPVDDPILIYRIRWSLMQAGDTDTIVHLRINGGGPFDAGGVPFFHAVTIPAGATAPDDDTNLGMFTNQVAGKGDTIRAATYQAGDFARGLVIRVFYTSQT